MLLPVGRWPLKIVQPSDCARHINHLRDAVERSVRQSNTGHQCCSLTYATLWNRSPVITPTCPPDSIFTH